VNLRVGVLAVAMSAVMLVSGCELWDDQGIDERVPCRATGLEVADSTAGGHDIIVRITGAVGPSGCYHLEEIERCRADRTWILSPMARHRVPEHSGCSDMVVPLDEIVSLEPADTGWTRIEVRSSGPLLLDSTYVQPAPSLPGAFSYTGRDSSGSVAVDGWLWITGSGAGRVSGEWDFRARGEPHSIGPQVGDGILWGWLELGRLEIDLNPVTPNNNVVLSGVLVGDRYSGEWTWYVSYVPKSRGVFEAQRSRR
jgi:hypothetical protein